MIKPPNLANELQRLKALHSHTILDTPAEFDFDDLTFLASVICKTPIALISLVDEKRQWFKSKLGTTAEETPRDIAFCAHAIAQPGLFEVPDALKDERFRDNPLVTADPNVRFYAGMPLKDSTGLPLGTICVIDNKPRTLDENQKKALIAISNQISLLLELRQSRRAAIDFARIKSEVFANVTHELRTPISGIIGLTELMLETKLDAEQNEYATQLKSTSSNFMKLIDNILDFASLEAGSDKVWFEEFDLLVMMEDLETLGLIQARQKGLKFTMNTALALPKKFRGDPSKVRTILRHIFENAIKFTEKGEITVNAELRNKKLYIEVRDTGIGIPLEARNKIFSGFGQVQSGSNRTFGGNGLGLAICARLVQLMGGEIGVQSEVGKGSLFWLTLPSSP